MRHLVFACIAMLFVPAAHATPPAASDSRALTTLAAQLDAAWDEGDAAAIAAFYTRDASLRMDGRPFVEGRDNVQRYFEDATRTRPAGLHHVTVIEHVDMLGEDLALVDTRARIEREQPAGGRQVVADFYNQTVARRENGTWRFRVVRAQRVAPPAVAR